MRYLLYTDGAASQGGRIAYGYILRTTGRFIHMSACSYTSGTIAVAETAAIGLGVEYILENCDIREGDSVEIRTDSKSVMKFLEDFDKFDRAPSRYELSRATWAALKKLEKKCPWCVKKIEAHNSKLNGNAIADRLAKFALRMKYVSVDEHLESKKEKEKKGEDK